MKHFSFKSLETLLFKSLEHFSLNSLIKPKCDQRIISQKKKKKGKNLRLHFYQSASLPNVATHSFLSLELGDDTEKARRSINEWRHTQLFGTCSLLTLSLIIPTPNYSHLVLFLISLVIIHTIALLQYLLGRVHTSITIPIGTIIIHF